MQIGEWTGLGTDAETELLLKKWLDQSTARTNDLMSRIGFAQWFICVALAVCYTPWTWIGQTAYVHLHCWVAFLAGGGLVLFPSWVAKQPQGVYPARMLFAISQVLFSVILIHLSGGRVETHFHVFGSMALLALYCSTRILVLATLMVIVDHYMRGVFWPQSVFGVWTESPYRWMEHAVWLTFLNAFLVTSILRRKREMKMLAERQCRLESLNKDFEDAVRDKTSELQKQAEWFKQAAQSASMVTWSWHTQTGRFDLGGEWRSILRVADHSLQSLGALCEAMHPQERELMKRSLSRIGEFDQGRIEKEFRLLREDGLYRWFRLIGERVKRQKDVVRGILIDIHDRKESEIRQEDLQREFAEISHKAGMAEIATGVLHNVGNGLNSITTSAGQLGRLLRETRLKALPAAAELLCEHQTDLPGFFANDERGKKLPAYLRRLADTWQQECQDLQSELKSMKKHVEHVRQVIQVQQRYASRVDLSEAVNLKDLLTGAIEATKPRLRGHEILLTTNLGDLPLTQTCRHSVLQIVYNLFSNAIESVVECGSNQPRLVELVATAEPENMVRISVRDSGVGFNEDQHRRMFQHGFTTKKNGHGFGLHSCSLLARKLGGELRAESPGLGQGACFHLWLPISKDQQNQVVSVVTSDLGTALATDPQLV